MKKSKKRSKQLQEDLKIVRDAILNGNTHAGVVSETWKPGKLLLDFDSPIAPKFTEISKELNYLGLTVKEMYYTRSSSGNWHIVIYLKEKLDIMATIFVQSRLGSDKEREAFNFIRAKGSDKLDEYVQILFERKLTEEEMKNL